MLDRCLTKKEKPTINESAGYTDPQARQVACCTASKYFIKIMGNKVNSKCNESVKMWNLLKMHKQVYKLRHY